MSSFTVEAWIKEKEGDAYHKSQVFVEETGIILTYINGVLESMDDSYTKVVVSIVDVNNEPYYAVKPKGIHTVNKWFGYNEQFNEIFNWCLDTFGTYEYEPSPYTPLPNQRWFVKDILFYFRDKADSEWFVLRWS